MVSVIEGILSLVCGFLLYLAIVMGVVWLVTRGKEQEEFNEM